MTLAELFGKMQIDAQPAGDPEPEKPAGDPEPEKPAGDPEPQPQGLTAENVKDIIKEELTEFFKDFQTANRNKDASGNQPTETYHDILKKHYEE